MSEARDLKFAVVRITRPVYERLRKEADLVARNVGARGSAADLADRIISLELAAREKLRAKRKVKS